MTEPGVVETDVEDDDEADWRRELVARAVIALAILGVQAFVVWYIEDPTRWEVLVRRARARWEKIVGPIRREQTIQKRIAWVHWQAEEVLREAGA